MKLKHTARGQTTLSKITPEEMSILRMSLSAYLNGDWKFRRALQYLHGKRNWQGSLDRVNGSIRQTIHVLRLLSSR